MTTSFREDLRAELVAAAARRQNERTRHRRVLELAAGVIVVVAVAVAVVGYSSRQPASAGVDIAVRDGELVVRLTDLESRPAIVQTALVEAGLDASVSALPTGPSQVGRFVGIRVSRGSTADLRRIDERNDTSAGFGVPVGWTGHLDLDVGRAARIGESYAASTDAFAPGEPLECSGVAGATLADALAPVTRRVPAARALGTVAGGEAMAPAPIAQFAAEHPTWRVVRAIATSPTDVLVVASVDGRPTDAAPAAQEGPC